MLFVSVDRNSLCILSPRTTHHETTPVEVNDVSGCVVTESLLVAPDFFALLSGGGCLCPVADVKDRSIHSSTRSYLFVLIGIIDEIVF